ncbi:MAG: hypothetical protein AAFZ09_02175, partial [Pseudomonadota bacterium]
GFQNVRIEEFPLVGWERGESSAAIVGDHAQALVAAALAAMAATLALATALAEPDEPARSLPAVSYDTRRAGGPG